METVKHKPVSKSIKKKARSLGVEHHIFIGSSRSGSFDSVDGEPQELAMSIVRAIVEDQDMRVLDLAMAMRRTLDAALAMNTEEHQGEGGGPCMLCSIKTLGERIAFWAKHVKYLAERMTPELSGQADGEALARNIAQMDEIASMLEKTGEVLPLIAHQLGAVHEWRSELLGELGEHAH
jgi:hypothetical protein